MSSWIQRVSLGIIGLIAIKKGEHTMKFEDVKVGMLVGVTGPHSVHFTNGAEVIEKCDTDLSIKIRNNDTGFNGRCSMEDINPIVEDTSTKSYFRKLPPTTLKVATYLGLDAENVTCYVDKENGTITVRQGNIEAKAKKSPKDTWDFRMGMGLALCRLKEKVSESKKLPFQTPYFCAMSTEAINHSIVGIYPSFFMDAIQYAMGNVFRTEEEAESACKEMAIRTQMIVDFCKKQGW